MNAVLGGLRAQLWSLRHSFDELQAFVIAPLLALIFGGVVSASGRPDLLPGAVLGAALMGMWTLCLQAGGNIIENERGEGTFEALVSTPARLRMVIVGRVTAIVGVMVLTLPQIWLLAWIVFGQRITIAHPAVFAVALAGMLVGLHATALLFAAVFVLAREALILQNAVAYPIYLLGGLVVPVSVLPDWLQPLTRLIFLSWGSDLLRASLRPETPAHLAASLAGLAVTSCAMIALGQFFLGRVIDRARRLGTLSLS